MDLEKQLEYDMLKAKKRKEIFWGIVYKVIITWLVLVGLGFYLVKDL